jgi:hypothetical protein
MDRRRFLLTSLAGALAGLALAGCSATATLRPEPIHTGLGTLTPSTRTRRRASELSRLRPDVSVFFPVELCWPLAASPKVASYQ